MPASDCGVRTYRIRGRDRGSLRSWVHAWCLSGIHSLETELREASNGRRGYLYRRQELLEISAVPVPMHSDALALRSRKADADDVTEAAEVSELRIGLRNLWEQVGRVVV